MTDRPALRSQRLKQLTQAPHTRLDALVHSHAPFDSRESFARFVVAQYLFQSELQPLYNDPQLIAIVPDLAERCRAEQARLDLADLDTAVPAAVPGALHQPGLGEALGWIFVSEGSKLGAAFLIKRAVALGLSDSCGARHLGEPAGGRAEGWKQFIRILDGLALSAEDEAAAERGAVAAFERFTELLAHAYAADAALA
ncbi:biliverdin-producing heme oxygenase [Pseudomonas sp. AFG_SD02_1510_Pfu_092]|uniref:biliverdin-producing heme oxygenase n=1 Tax=Pseudomonas sp. AFG_SD02_1510_Pfu_092 TaxID=2259497 RepID=UPI000DEF2877|nr:biliverdin-producing heme oxygenase [Pseudomonas sp. AFG_SD02_1510_Pfu_092]RCL24457.1 biliverdin-producing heme oxygenase [Pseudomonas sp. AFG_SD02_1510_Pfu_092]